MWIKRLVFFHHGPRERERLAQSKPKLKRGRPSSKDKAARRLARKSKAIQQKISDLFEHRFLFVQREYPRKAGHFMVSTS
jgi:hypothetical protein